MPTIHSRRRRSTLIPDEEGCRDHMDFELASAVDSDSDRNSVLSPSSMSSTLSSLHSTPIPSSTPSPSPSPTPSPTSTFSGGNAGQSCHRQHHPDSRCSAPDDQPFVLTEHPAVVFASDRLSDKTTTERFHTANVFDFDQTLFQSPLPNPALWDPSFIGVLTSWNYCGTGWWHNPGTLELGPETEASCWEGWWNEEIVTKVKESSADPGCLTVLLTGRNGPTFGQKLIQMVTAKGLDFDLIATKPTTVARIPTTSKTATTPIPVNGIPSTQSLTPSTSPAKSPRKQQDKHNVEKYLKVHTFNTKHDFLYNLLFEYPKIRTMHLWDDRPCQVAKFRQAGQEWLDKKMLDHFEITVVQEPMLYLDLQLETDLVLAMVEANNRQVEIEQAGGPFLVPGVGLCPRTRPELRDRAIWDPYETYVPQKRLRIDVNTIVRYTGVMFSESVQDVMKDIFLGNLSTLTLTSTASLDRPIQSQEPWIERPLKLRGQDLSKWVVPDDLHVTFCLGSSTPEHLEAIGGLGATALVEVEATGEFENRVWALKVKEHDLALGQEEVNKQVLYLAPNGKLYPDLSSLKADYPSGSQQSKPTPFVDQQTALDSDRKDNDQSQHHQDLSAVTKSLENVDLTRLGHVILKKKEVTPHVTMAYDRLNGTRAVDSGKIENWESLERTASFTVPLSDGQDGKEGAAGQQVLALPLPDGPLRLVLIGTIAQKKLLGMKAKSSAAVQTKAEVSLANVIKSCSGDSTIASGKELGLMVKAVKEEMERMGVENRLANEERIVTIAQEVCDRAVNMRQAGQGTSSPDDKDPVPGQVSESQVGQAPPPPIVFQAAE
ncbi:hypothetical protein EMPS_06812 [Entomortierella parvispora]|uniref:Swiss Army Knife RNA repair protein HAD domain-containing protein n=1 Tax=Entomortierella parvispora TaxID=205924 RepID=A0A9P3LXS3_9FUNG|nr:hypothetical protein EMPS_06812 [Entomortierella parvispora]